jgi:lysophospholipase L1-like esterase
MTRTLVCFGDSLTEGAIGASYVDVLRAELPGVRVVNAGINGDTTINLLRRAERDVIAHHPDFIIILVGLNDLATVYGDRLQRRYYHMVKRVRIELTPRRFAQSYRQLIRLLRERTNAQLALCTLTTLGEAPDEPIQQQVDAYSHIIRALADQEGLPLIDVRRAFWDAICADPRPGPPYKLWMPLLDQAAVRLGQNYAGIAAKRGYHLLCDGVHLGDAGARLVADTMLPYFRF